ncbi:MAG: peptide ligase PGM1-related protein [Acidobacteriota bacterium]|nr:peptide ligase PGM1-related protein [Acidobacteriota bacterium]
MFPDPMAPRTVVIIPSLTLDPEILAKISGAHHYEERMLCLLMLLRFPRTQLIFVTSQPVDPIIVDYFLNLLPGVPVNHARKRLVLMSCYDASPVSLTTKVLARPRLVARMKEKMQYPQSAHMTCFNATPLERSLAVALDIPLFACDPDLTAFGSKSGGRRIFREAGIPIPPGFESLRDQGDVINALAELKRMDPNLRRAVVKLDEGFSGEGNAIFDYTDAPQSGSLLHWVEANIVDRLRFAAPAESFEPFMARFGEMSGIVETFIEGKQKTSPSVQCRINPGGKAEVISTHDQVMGGHSGQVFLGCTFPANREYRLEIQEMGARVARLLRGYDVLGRFGVDFISVAGPQGWKHYAIEINLRKGGTTHPFMMLQFLTDGEYDADTGKYLTPTGRARYYFCTDNLENEIYRGLTAEDLIDIAVCNGLHFHGASQEGVVFHLIGALSEFGKLGVVAIGRTPERARKFYEKTVEVLHVESRRHHGYTQNLIPC